MKTLFARGADRCADTATPPQQNRSFASLGGTGRVAAIKTHDPSIAARAADRITEKGSATTMQSPTPITAPTSRSLRCLAWALAAIAAIAAFAAPAAQASDGSFTQVLCRNPDTRVSTTPNGTMPDGMSAPYNLGYFSGIDAGAKCSSHGYIWIPQAQSTTAHSTGAGLSYRSGPVTFNGATLYRHSYPSGGWGAVIQQSGGWNGIYGFPWTERCFSNPANGANTCTNAGSHHGDWYAAGNRVTVGSTGTNGFDYSLLCEASNDAPTCPGDTGRGITFYGAKVHLSENTNPVVEAGSLAGDVATDLTLKGVEELTYTATDTISGVYRAKLLVDGAEKVAQIADGNGGKCADINAANGDAYEFAHRQPCKASVNGTLTIDTATLAEGSHNIKVQVEDAAGNTITALNRNATVDNIPPPTATAPPTISGQTRRGQQLTVVAATIDAHGAPSELKVARQWKRCTADGSCVNIPGASGASYTPTTADLNRALRIVETWTNAEGDAIAESVPTARITREDGTLPPGNDGEDNDGDGQIDEPGEETPATPVDPVDNPTPTPVPNESGNGANGLNGANGNNGTNGQSGANAADSRSLATTIASAGAPNGEGASPRAKLSAAFGKSTTGKVAYGKSLTARGRLVDESGRPIRNAIVDVAETAALRGARPVPGRAVVTDGDGQFTYTVASKTGTRTVTFVYRYLRQGAPVSQASLAVTVRAGIQLKVRLRGIVASYSGRVLAGSMPRGGKLVIVQGRAKGGPWQTFASRRAAKKTGKFSGRYRLKVRRPGKKLQFRVKVLTESGWNYASVTSKAVTQTVR